MYEYRARVTEVHDGDTFTLAIDLGLMVSLVGQKLRLAHVNAPELNTPEGQAARAWVFDWMPVGSLVTISTIKAEGDKEKYGRWLAQITLHDGSDLATMMVNAGHAVPYEGGPR